MSILKKMFRMADTDGCGPLTKTELRRPNNSFDGKKKKFVVPKKFGGKKMFGTSINN